MTPADQPILQKRRLPGHATWMSVVICLLPALLLYALFVLYPIVQSARYSLYAWNGFGPLEDFIGLDNFADVFADARFRAALTHNLIIVGLSLLVQLPAALGVGNAAQRQTARPGGHAHDLLRPYVFVGRSSVDLIPVGSITVAGDGPMPRVRRLPAPSTVSVNEPGS